jgi:transposase
MNLPKLGIDVAKQTCEGALLQEGKYQHKKFANSPGGFRTLEEWLQGRGVVQVHAILEATGTYGEALALQLYEAGHQVSIVNPARIKAFGQSELQRNKTDRTDAALIARFAEKHKSEAWTPPPAELQLLKALVRHLDDLGAQRRQWQQRLTEGHPLPAVQESLQQVIRVLEEQEHQIEGQIGAQVAKHAELHRQHELLLSIPGIGTTTAVRLLAEMPTLLTFRSARQAAAYAGLTPRRHESGTSVHGRTHLSKLGNPRVRKALYWPAITALQFNPLIRQFGQRLRERGKPKMAVIGAAMRKLIHLVYGVIKTGKRFDATYAVTA